MNNKTRKAQTKPVSAAASAANKQAGVAKSLPVAAKPPKPTQLLAKSSEKAKPVKAKPVKDKQVKDKQVKDKPVKDKQVKEKQVKEKQVKEKQVKEKQVKEKRVRGSFSMPRRDYALIAELKARSKQDSLNVKKNELLRAGLRSLAGLSAEALRTTLSALEPGAPVAGAKLRRPGH